VPDAMASPAACFLPDRPQKRSLWVIIITLWYELLVRNHKESWGHYPGSGNKIWISEWLAEQYENFIQKGGDADP